MFATRRTVKLWPNAYIKFGGGRAMRFSKGGGDAQAERFTGLLPTLIFVAAVMATLLLAIFLFANH